MHKWLVYNTFDEASKAAANFIADEIESCITQRNICHVILPGGNTPAKCLSYLTEKTLAWNRVHWYPGDERCYPAGHSDRNDVMLEQNLWSRLTDTHVHKIPAELGAEEAAQVYADLVADIKYFDIAFLGMGEDGHTASLFPDNKALLDSRSVIPVHDSPKTPDDRVSFSVSTLMNARTRIVLTSGRAKADIIKRVKNGEALPINSLGDINWFLDKAAATESV